MACYKEDRKEQMVSDRTGGGYHRNRSLLSKFVFRGGATAGGAGGAAGSAPVLLSAPPLHGWAIHVYMP
jgi:hypothetical protein